MPKRSVLDRFVPLILILTVVLAFFVGFLWQKVLSLEKNAKSGTPTTATNTTQTPPSQPTVTLDKIKALFGNKDLITFGDADRKVLFIEVSDPSCPFCHAAAGLSPNVNAQLGAQFKLVSQGGTYVAPVPEMEKLVNSGKASFVYIYFPGHGNGEMATKALYCANEQGKFWEVHNQLMTDAGYNLLNNTVKSDKSQSGTLANFLKSVFDPTQMKSCLDSGKYDVRLTEDTQIATDLGVSGTPGFFINTVNFPGAVSYKDMESAVNSALGS
ncbi:DsbA family protein [Patescibacteria group bacterium]|nr:DsbA family protein [Patescibacteria group bacterium]